MENPLITVNANMPRGDGSLEIVWDARVAAVCCSRCDKYVHSRHHNKKCLTMSTGKLDADGMLCKQSLHLMDGG